MLSTPRLEMRVSLGASPSGWKNSVSSRGGKNIVLAKTSQGVRVRSIGLALVRKLGARVVGQWTYLRRCLVVHREGNGILGIELEREKEGSRVKELAH